MYEFFKSYPPNITLKKLNFVKSKLKIHYQLKNNGKLVAITLVVLSSYLGLATGLMIFDSRYGDGINEYYETIYHELRDPRYNVTSFDQYLSFQNRNADQIYVIMRHDVDNGDTFRMCQNIRNLMQLELNFGFNSTFFFITYFDSSSVKTYDIYSSTGIALIHEIKQKHFEIGLHSNWYSGELTGQLSNSTEYMIQDITRFEDTMDVDVEGLAAHGSRACAKAHAVNYDLYRSINPAVFGLRYYACNVTNALSFSDGSYRSINIAQLIAMPSNTTVIINIHSCYPNLTDECLSGHYGFPTDHLTQIFLRKKTN